MADRGGCAVCVDRLASSLSSLFPDNADDFSPSRLKEMAEDGARSRRYRTLCLTILRELSCLSRRKDLSFSRDLGEGDFIGAVSKALNLLHYPSYADLSLYTVRLDVLRFLCTELQVEKLLWDEGESEKGEEMEVDGKGGEREGEKQNSPATLSSLDGYMNKICTDLGIVEDVVAMDASPVEAMQRIASKLHSLPPSSLRRPKLLRDANVLGAMSGEEMKLLHEVEDMLNTVI